MGREASVCLILIMLTGCNAQPPEPMRDAVFAHVQIVDALPPPEKSGELARAIFNNGICTIWIRRDVYPACITHEIMHCFSDSWHDGYETDEYCRD